MSATTPSTRAESGFKYGAATVLLVGLVSGAAQFLAIGVFGIGEYVEFRGGFGPGLVAIIAGIVMWVTCRSWEYWRTWIWLPIVIGAAVAFLVTAVFAQSIAGDVAAEEERVEQCTALWQQLESTSDEIDDLKAELAVWQAPRPQSVPQPSWVSDDGARPAPSWSEEAKLETAITEAQLEYTRLHDAHLTSCRDAPRP